MDTPELTGMSAESPESRAVAAAPWRIDELCVGAGAWDRSTCGCSGVRMSEDGKRW
jgi:hypothetical protein